jgi:ABC-2 type transport system permease protein
VHLRKVLLVAKRDYLAAVMRKAFIIGLVAAPLLFGGGFFVIALMRVTQGTTARHVAIVDHTGIVTDSIIAAAHARAEEDRTTLPAGASPLLDNNFVFETVPPDLKGREGQRVALSDRVRHHELFAFVEIGRDAVNPPKDLTTRSDKPKIPAGLITYYSDSQSAPARFWISGVVDEGIRRVRLQRLGVDAGRFEDLMRAVPMETMSLVSRGQQSAGPSRNTAAAFAVPFALMFLMMMIAMMGSAPMLTAVAEDKMQRVFEMLLASAKPFELIAGKVVASVGVSLTSSVFYIVGGLFVLQGMALMGIAPFELLPWFFIYLICEVVILSSLGAALGSACGTPNDAQQYVFLVVLPVIAPVFFIGPLMEQPNGVMATVASLIPPFTPLIMMMRQAMPGGVPAWEPWAGLLIVLVWTLLSTFAAARIFRVGILMQGRAPKLPEMVRWALRG